MFKDTKLFNVLKSAKLVKLDSYYSDGWAFTGFGLALNAIAIVSIVLTILLSFIVFVEKEACETYSVVTSRDTLYTAGKCFAKIDGNWVPTSEIVTVIEK